MCAGKYNGRVAGCVHLALDAERASLDCVILTNLRWLGCEYTGSGKFGTTC